MSPAVTSVDTYLETCEAPARDLLERIRTRLRATVAGYGETISYAMPTVTVDGSPVLYYAAWKKHVGVYPVPVGDADDEAVVGPWRAAKDAVHLPYGDAFPWDVLDRIVRLVLARRT